MKFTNLRGIATLLLSMAKALGWMTFIYRLLVGFVLDGFWRESLLKPMAEMRFTNRWLVLIVPVLAFITPCTVASFSDSFSRRRT